MTEYPPKKITATVGIPAYNEENNIGNLLTKIFEQRTNTFILEKVIIIVDGSTDKTADIIQKFSNPAIEMICEAQRQGLMAAQNKICQISQSDYLILLDADVIPSDNLFIENLIRPLEQSEDVGIVGAATESLPGNNFFSSTIAISHQLKQKLYQSLADPDNVYLCHGRARAFRKSLYKKIIWPDAFPEDAYSYFYCISAGFKFKYCSSAKIFFRSPSDLDDHLKQSLRFINGTRRLRLIFKPAFVKSKFKIAPKHILGFFVSFTIKYPVKSFLYGLVSLIARVVYLFDHNQSHAIYEPSLSSKKI